MDRDEYERRFRRAGLPVFVAGRTAATDIWTRATPLLSLVFALELLGAIDLQWSPLANVGAVAGGLAVLAPAVLPLIFGGQFRSALVTALGNALLLLLLYGTIGFGPCPSLPGPAAASQAS
jgi:uncharacterized membrane protein